MINLQRELYLMILAALRAYRASLSHNELAQANVDYIITQLQQVYQ